MSAVQGRLWWSCECCAGKALLVMLVLCRAGIAGHVSAVQGRLCWSCECCAGQALLVM